MCYIGDLVSLSGLVMTFFSFLSFFLNPHPRTPFHCFQLLAREEGREKNIHVGCLPHMRGPGIEPATQVCVLTGHQTHNPLIIGQHSNQLSHTSQGCHDILAWGATVDRVAKTAYHYPLTYLAVTFLENLFIFTLNGRQFFFF